MKVVMIDSLVGNDYSFWLCRGLAKAGVDVVLICPENRQGMEESFLLLPVSPAKAGNQGKIRKTFKYVYFLGWLFFYLWRSQPDIIHYQFFRRERIECLYFPLLSLLNIPLFFTAHNVLPHEHQPLDHFLRNLVYQSATKIIVHTTTIKARLLERFTIPTDKVAIIPAVKPVSGLRDLSITKTIGRDYLDLLADDKVLLFFGYIREYKGLELLLKAFDIAKVSDSKLKLIVAGKPQSQELFEQYQSQIQAMNFGESVLFKPEFIPKDAVDYYFRAADALAVPYSRIDLSGVLQEAFAYGLPVLATDVGNFKELIQQGVNGYVSQQNTAEEFAEIIDLAFQDMDALGVQGEAALAIDQNYPSWETIGLLSYELYRQM